MQGKQDQTNDSVRLTYTAPQMTEFGRVRDLTAGGSGLASENKNQMETTRHP